MFQIKFVGGDCAIYVGKYGTARHAKNYNMAHALCMLLTTKGHKGRHAQWWVGEERGDREYATQWEQWIHKRVSVLWQMHITCLVLVLQYTKMNVMFLHDTLASNWIWRLKCKFHFSGHNDNTDGHFKHQVS